MTIEVYPEYAPGGQFDTVVGYDPYDMAAGEYTGGGYLDTGTGIFEAASIGESVGWGGSSDPYAATGTPASRSTSDAVRSIDAGIPYPSNPINTVPPAVGDSSSSFDSGLFKGIADVASKALGSVAGIFAQQAASRLVPGVPASSATIPGAPMGLPARPFVLPSWLGGGTFSGGIGGGNVGGEGVLSGGMSTWLIVGGAVVALLLLVRAFSK